MDALLANISATCPLAFTGVSGSLFAKAVATVIAAHCSIVADRQWPRDSSEDIIGRATEGVSYDFIIVGSGTAGSLLASRLSDFNHAWSVLVVEAGDDPGLDSEVPGLFFYNRKSNLDWNYKTYPDSNTCLGFDNDTCYWSKGKAMGGSSSINAMYYIRGHPKDYDNWENLGNPGWKYDDLIPHFENVEKHLNMSNYEYPDNLWYNVIEGAWKELGFISHEKHSVDEALLGVRQTKLLTKNGKRLSTAHEYLKEAKNVHVIKNTIVQKVIIDPDSRITTGVEIRHANGVVMQISAAKEVILSAGSIATPQILMLSGIGPKKHLNKNGIKCIMDLPVGQNLEDHVHIPLLLQTNQNLELPSDTIIYFILQYMLARSGPLSYNSIADYMGFSNLQNNTDYPDIQFMHGYYTKKDNFLKDYMKNGGFKEEIVDAINELNKKHDFLAVCPILLHPKSKGEILLADTDPKLHPVIKPNYFQHTDDMKTLLKSIEYVHTFENTNHFKSLGIKLVHLKIPGCLQFSFDTESYWECYIRHMATTLYHPVGTAKMGSESVVNHHLLVHGVQKLRVVDASIMPSIPGANTMAATLVIAEKASSIIKKQYTKKDDL